MARLEPFRALRYDPARVALSSVATQPYDKITPEMQERYYASSPYNLVRIILGKREPSDNPADNPYTRARACFGDWRERGILRQDPEPSIYRYLQRFPVPGGDPSVEVERLGLIALGKIEDYSSGVVFRHEQTLPKPKADRLELLRATRAHFGQIFMLYTDPGRAIERSLGPAREPEIEIRDEYGVLHGISRISDSGIIDRVQGEMRDKQLIIADGHHRYETALAYRNERRGEGRSDAGPIELCQPYEFVMMTLVNMDSPGLVILATHRVVHGLRNFSPERFRSGASEFFSVVEADHEITDARAASMLKEAGRAGTAFIAVSKDRAFLLSRPRSPAAIFEDVPLRQQGLDVVQLHKALLERVLGISEEAIRDQKNVSYIRDSGEALSRVRSGAADIAFLMNPVVIGQLREAAFAGEVLPQKSTDFYPKLLSGLTIYALE
ncbi:MAG: DUF1015 domain-containing protein [Acidobacteria bacterium]|nr:DUF1015 domain-containing protein [Acidobacteriota bacterium]